MNFERQTGDLDAMVKRGSIRALVLYSRSGFFYVNGQPEGIYYEALQYFERFVNEKLHTRQHLQLTFIPVRPDQLEAALNDGVGDVIAYGMAVTPEREQQVAFSLPLQTDVKQIVATQKDLGPLTSLEQSNKVICIDPDHSKVIASVEVESPRGHRGLLRIRVAHNFGAFLHEITSR